MHLGQDGRVKPGKLLEQVHSERGVIPVGRTHGAVRYPSVVALLGEGL